MANANETNTDASDASARPSSEQLSRLQTVLDSTTAGVYAIDERGRCTYVNRVGAEMLGYAADELLGVDMHGLIHHSRADGTPYPVEECLIQQSVRRGAVSRLDNEVLWRRDGTALPVEYTVAPILEGDAARGAVITFLDITRRRHTEAALDAERARLERIFVNAPAVIALYSGPDHVISLVNPTWEKVVGRTDVVGKTFREVFPELVGTPLLDILDDVFRTGTAYVGSEAHVRLERNGALEDTYWNFVWQPLPGLDGNTAEIFVHAVEVTDQVRARHTAERQAEELRRVAQALEASNRELDQFAYIASHDLKAPLRGLASISAWIEEDLEGGATPQIKQHLDLLRGRVHRLEALIEGVLQYSRAGRLQYEVERVNTATLVRDVIELLSVPEHVVIEVGRDMPVLEAERLPLQQVFMNLLGNAVKYARVEAPRVRVSARDAGAFWDFAVQDNGPGIAAEYHDRIFKMFQRLESRDEVEGTGVGLSIVQKLVETRRGRVWVESEHGAGSTFRFLWPKVPPLRAASTDAS
jgi:PAS domain S-box-containing protein